MLQHNKIIFSNTDRKISSIDTQVRIHRSKLQSSHFDALYLGKKNYVIRIYNNKKNIPKDDDLWIFDHENYDSEPIITRVIQAKMFDNIYDVFNKVKIEDLLLDIENFKNLVDSLDKNDDDIVGKIFIFKIHII